MTAIFSVTDIAVPPTGGYLRTDRISPFLEQMGDVIGQVMCCFAEICPLRFQLVIAYAAIFQLISYPLSIDK